MFIVITTAIIAIIMTSVTEENFVEYLVGWC